MPWRLQNAQESLGLKCDDVQRAEVDRCLYATIGVSSTKLLTVLRVAVAPTNSPSDSDFCFLFPLIGRYVETRYCVVAAGVSTP